MASLKVWSKFSVTKSDGQLLKLRIQDMPVDKFEDVMDFNINNFVKYESFHKAAGIPNNVEALQECRDFASEMMKDPTTHISVCCPDNDGDDVSQIIGVSSMSISTKDEEFNLDDFQFKTNEMKRFFELMDGQYALYDVMEKQDLEKSFDGRGIAVHPDFRGLGIATEFCKTRPLICKEKDVPVTWAWMTSLGSQKAAERAGWDTIFQISFKELADKLQASFDGAPETCKIMICKIK